MGKEKRREKVEKRRVERDDKEIQLIKDFVAAMIYFERLKLKGKNELPT